LDKKKSYLETCQSGFWKEVFERELEYLLRELRGCTNILSVGCGPAIIERGLQENGFNVTGLDISKQALDGAPDSIRTVVGSAENMQFQDHTYDAAIYIASLQFISDYARALEETARVLKPNGKILIMLLNPESEFFKEKNSQPESYMNKIKHAYISPIEEAVSWFFYDVKREYYLGIQNNEIFESQDTALAALYVIRGIKK